MPAIYAHRRFGELVFESLSEPLKKAFEPYRECYLLGFEGPDILFYHKPFKTNEPKKKALTTHLLPAKNFFISNAKKINAIETENKLSTPLAAYVAGFICHFCLDNACHPRVYELQFTGVSHGLIESEFDKFLFKKERGEAFGYNPARELLNTVRVQAAAATVLEVPQSAIKRAIKTIRFINGVFVCRSRLIHKLIHLLLKILKKDDSFGQMLIHHEDDDACLTIMDGLCDDLQKAVSPAAELIEDFFNNLETTAQTGVVNDLFDKNYTGGILDEHHQPIRRNPIGEETDPA